MKNSPFKLKVKKYFNLFLLLVKFGVRLKQETVTAIFRYWSVAYEIKTRNKYIKHQFLRDQYDLCKVLIVSGYLPTAPIHMNSLHTARYRRTGQNTKTVFYMCSTKKLFYFVKFKRKHQQWIPIFSNLASLTRNITYFALQTQWLVSIWNITLGWNGLISCFYHRFWTFIRRLDN